MESSWQRCRQYGMAPQWHIHQNLLRENELHREHEQHRHLRRLGLREFPLLDRLLAGTGHLVVLASVEGTILDSHGSGEFLTRAQRVCLMPGACWREQITGTNAIGTALVERRYTQVVGGQHFFDENRFLACAGMPIISPDGQLAGVLDISGRAAELPASVGRLVRHAVMRMEHDWVLEWALETAMQPGARWRSATVVRLHPHPSWLGSPEEGVMVFEDGLLRAASPRGLHYAGLSTRAIGCARREEIFAGRLRLGPQELRLQSAEAGHPAICFGVVERLGQTAFAVTAGPTAALPSCTGTAHQATVETAAQESFQSMKDDALRRALAAANGNVSDAARRLGVNRSTFYRRLKRPVEE
ncbi:helix-turn-helix domain-containing protein [Silvibacterium sp.]|uniref:helix-turn-helix domain-containing protein n=1 Tax=Silvibacterium sp. TaxID=1964179 RepID=UPI0039E2C79E